MEKLPIFQDVADAAKRIRGVVRHTPMITNSELDRHVGRPVFVKCEPLQVTGSFKFRGAYNRLVQVPVADRHKGVVAFSSGNHAQGVSRAAAMLGIPATIVMPEDAPAIKKAGVLRDGGTIVSINRRTDDREAVARKLVEETGALLVPSYDDADIMAGQGSIAMEMLDDLSDTNLGSLYCCLGGGGLLSGISLGFETRSPKTALFGVEPEAMNDFQRSLKAGERVKADLDAETICDALMTPTPGHLTFGVLQRTLTGIHTVSDDEVKAAMRFAFQHLKIVVEPGGAAALARVLSASFEPANDGPVGVVLTGGNTDPATFAAILADA